ncbi:hypothetical protein FOZ60_000405, partial [Perkinsus olseni]
YPHIDTNTSENEFSIGMSNQGDDSAAQTYLPDTLSQLNEAIGQLIEQQQKEKAEKDEETKHENEGCYEELWLDVIGVALPSSPPLYDTVDRELQSKLLQHARLNLKQFMEKIVEDHRAQHSSTTYGLLEAYQMEYISTASTLGNYRAGTLMRKRLNVRNVLGCMVIILPARQSKRSVLVATKKVILLPHAAAHRRIVHLGRDVKPAEMISGLIKLAKTKDLPTRVRPGHKQQGEVFVAIKIIDDIPPGKGDMPDIFAIRTRPTTLTEHEPATMAKPATPDLKAPQVKTPVSASTPQIP